MIRTGGFPLDQVRLEMYENKGNKTMREVWSTLKPKPTLLLNGPFFSWETMEGTCHLKIHGKVIKNEASKAGYGEWGWAWNDGEAPIWTKLPAPQYDNYFTNSVVVVDGKKRTGSMLIWHKDADGTPLNPRYTSRPATGQKGNLFMYCIHPNCSLPGLRDYLADSKWSNVIIGDGGGSTEGKTTSWEYYSSRRVPYYILVYLVDNELKGDKPMIPINAYSLKRDGKKKLSDNFQVGEFKCPDGTDPIFVAPSLVELLQKIRDHYNKPVHIDSGYRTPTHNKKVKGVTYSQHLYGTAADIHISGVPVAELAKYARSIMPTGGVGTYTKSGFVHVDVREAVANWSE